MQGSGWHTEVKVGGSLAPTRAQPGSLCTFFKCPINGTETLKLQHKLNPSISRFLLGMHVMGYDTSQHPDPFVLSFEEMASTRHRRIQGRSLLAAHNGSRTAP